MVFAAALALSSTGLWRAWERAVQDFLVRTKTDIAPSPLSPRIFPVELNDRAERNLGSAIESRKAFAALLGLLGEGRLAGGMDSLFAGTKDAAGDAAMAAAAGRMSSLVVAVAPIDPGITRFSGREPSSEEKAVLEAHLWHPRVLNAGRIPAADTFILPFTALAKASAYLGHIGVRPDSDGIYRKTPLFFRWGDGYVPSLSLALAAAALRLDIGRITVDAGHAVTLPAMDGPIRISVDEEGCAWIPYPAAWASAWRRTPLDKVVSAAADPDSVNDLLELWDGGIVLADDITTGGKDFGPTPIEAVYPLSGIHESFLNGILTRRLVADPPLWLGPAIAMLLGTAIWALGRSTRPALVHLGFGALLAALAALALIQWFACSIVPWFVPPAAALALAWLAAGAVRLAAAREERVLLESALSRYFSRALAGRVLEEKRVELPPASKELTILFADIVGFTRWCSDKEPELVHGFLSDYLETMSEIVFSYGGTVDKFMGDGILAFFGDPFDQPDHAVRGADAALEMRGAVGTLCERWGERACIELRVRIGLNTGRVVVGNLGSKTRIEYTVIGAAVNLAERMEANAPENGILAAEATCAALGEDFEFGERTAIEAKGYDGPVAARVLKGRRSTR